MDDGTNLAILTSISELAVHSVALFQTGNDLSLVEECTWQACYPTLLLYGIVCSGGEAGVLSMD